MRLDAAPIVHRAARYAIGAELAAGGMGTVHYGRLLGPAGFSRTVAIKRLHPSFAKDPEFVANFLDEARLAAHVHHPNVATTVDVVAERGSLLVVMEYVHGDSLARLLGEAWARGMSVPIAVASSIAAGALHGLHAAHEAMTQDGAPLHIVHRDVSPQNIMVGVDGLAKVVDFGIAKAAWRAPTTREGQLKGKLAYMAPEQLNGGAVDRRADVFALGIVLWEMLAGRRLFEDVPARIAGNAPPIKPPSTVRDEVPRDLDALVTRALSRDADERFASAREMAVALERLVPPATATDVGDWVRTLLREDLETRAVQMAAFEDRTRQVAATRRDEGHDEGAPSSSRIWDAATDVAPSSAAAPEGVTPPVTTTRRRGRRGALVAAGVVLLGALALGVALALPKAGTGSAAAPEASSEAAALEPAASNGPGAGESASASAAEPAPDVVPLPPAPNEPRPPEASKGAAVRPSAHKAGGGAVHKPSAGCQPPYTVDADGMTHFNVACLREQRDGK